MIRISQQDIYDIFQKESYKTFTSKELKERLKLSGSAITSNLARLYKQKIILINKYTNGGRTRHYILNKE